MLGSNVLEIAIGMLLIYSILSLISSAMTELIAEWFIKLRSRKLYEWVSFLLSSDDPANELTNKLYNHPLITSLTWQDGKSSAISGIQKPDISKSPADIPARRFALALLDVLRGDDKSKTLADFDAIQSIVAGAANGDQGATHVKAAKQLLVMLEAVENEKDKVQAAWKTIETWFDNTMKQATLRYKQNIRIITFFVGFALCIVINADSLMMVNALSNDPALRSILLAEADKFVTAPPAGVQQPSTTDSTDTTTQESEATATEEPAEITTDQEGTSAGDAASVDTDTSAENIKTIQELQQELIALNLFGWASRESDDRRAVPGDFIETIFKLAGILITAAAISLGAPFWFDIMRKLVQMRQTSSESSSSDQKPAGG